VTGVTATAAMTDVAVTEAVAETATPESATETSSTQVSTVGTATAVTITVNDEGTPVFLVDGQGRALYVYLLDTPDSNMSACIDAECMSAWPAVLVTGTPTAGEGVDSALLGTITRDDGQMQATYNSWPLYYFDEDLDPGDMNGQGVDGEWFLVSPEGEPIQP
jgi:predicted lipoprotein with Yx(FWY)xxD motif